MVISIRCWLKLSRKPETDDANGKVFHGTLFSFSRYNTIWRKGGFLRRKIVDSRGWRIWMSRRSPVHSTWTQTMTNPKWMLHRCFFHNDVLHSHNPRVTMPVFAISVNRGKPIRRLGKISVGAVAEYATAFVIKETETNVGQTVVLCWQIREKLVQFIQELTG